MRPLAPHEYAMVYVLINEDLAAGEVAATWPVSKRGVTAQVIGAQLYPLVKRGWVERLTDFPHIYRATQAARDAVCW